MLRSPWRIETCSRHLMPIEWLAERGGRPMADLAPIKARQQQMWSTGDYLLASVDLVLVSELLCEALGLRAGQQVLDVATGTGNTALAAARRRCDVIGV